MILKHYYYICAMATHVAGVRKSKYFQLLIRKFPKEKDFTRRQQLPAIILCITLFCFSIIHTHILCFFTLVFFFYISYIHMQCRSEIKNMKRKQKSVDFGLSNGMIMNGIKVAFLFLQVLHIHCSVQNLRSLKNCGWTPSYPKLQIAGGYIIEPDEFSWEPIVL